MPKITDMKECKNKDRINIYIDGEFVCAMEKFVAYKTFLKIGKEITPERLEEIREEEERETATKRAVAYVTKYRVTKKRAKEYLEKKEYSPQIILETMEKLERYSLVDDEKYARDFMAQNIKKKGSRRIKMELSQKGISKTILDTLEKEVEKEEQSCMANAQKYMKRKEPTRENFAKLYRHLQGKGYDFDTIGKVVGAIRGGENEDWM